MASNFVVQIFAENLTETFEHYKKAFNADILFEGKADNGDLIHLEMNIMGNRIALSPPLPCGNIKGNITVLCLKFQQKEALLTAYNILQEDGHSNGLSELPWSPLEGYVTDKYGVNWCIGL
ncbi:MAG: hypothetical protein LBH95_08660 [Oscillospiraceae bacterium]|nr:hypothetical protein [Oscillospiraceae bacterium]